MKKFILDLVLTLALCGLIAFLFGENIWSLLKEVVILYAVIFSVGIALMVYIFWALQRAMNPKLPPKEEIENGR